MRRGIAKGLVLILGVAAVVWALPAHAAAPSFGFVSWWQAEGDYTDSADSNAGTPVNGAAFAPGKIGQAFSFNGVDQYVSVPDASNLDFGATSPLSISAWVYRTSGSSLQHILGKRPLCGPAPTYPTNYQLLVSQQANLDYNFVFGAEPTNSAQGGNVPLNSWTHVAGTFDGASFSAYVDGALVGTGTGTLGAISTADLRIGSSGDCEKFGGLVDEVRIYSRALSANEVRHLARSKR